MKFNFLKRKETQIVNYQGAKAYAISPEAELYTTVVTASLSNTFYERTDNRLARIGELIEKTDTEFVAKLAVYARKQMNMRSVPLVLAVELAKRNSGNAIVSKAVSGVVQRADEITELLAYYQAANKRDGLKKLNKLSKQVQKGLAGSFNKFDEYQFAKYNRATEVTLRDALFLAHPKAKNEEQQQLFNKIAKQELAVPYTWETELSALGQATGTTQEQRWAARTAKWQELIDSNCLGYMATLRNLRNMLNATISHTHISKVCALLASADAVAKAKQLPFRFLSAYREVLETNSLHTSMVLNALEEAIKHSATNIKGFQEQSVLIACDVSGSMYKPVSAHSSARLFDIGLVLGMLMQSKCKSVVTGMFGSTWKVINMPSNQILSNVQQYYKREGEVGYSTNGYLVIDYLIRKKMRIDKVMLFTDCQLWNSQYGGAGLQESWKKYKNFHPAAQLYLFDLAGYGNTPLDLRQGDVHLIAGWSDKIFDVLDAIENNSNAVDKVKETIL